MIWTVLICLLSSVITCFFGYWTHRSFHCKWSGPFYTAHTNHHFKQYPPDGPFTSDTYKGAGTQNTFWYFTLAFLPIIAIIIGSVFFLGISIWTCICVIGSMIGTGLLHDRIHDAFHLTKTKWQYLPLFAKWQALHRLHHTDQKSNFGIFSFTLDKVFKTFKDR